jgi:hypothetical protein
MNISSWKEGLLNSCYLRTLDEGHTQKENKEFVEKMIMPLNHNKNGI